MYVYMYECVYAQMYVSNLYIRDLSGWLTLRQQPTALIEKG